MFPQLHYAFIILITASIHCQKCSANRNSEIAEILHGRIRSFTFPSSSTMGIFFALALPLSDTDRSLSMSIFLDANYDYPTNASYSDPWQVASRRRRSISRTKIYELLENEFGSAGLPRRRCLLRAICEAAESSVQHNGILGDVMHVILTPSTSENENLPEEVVEAERIGRDGTCSKYYNLCSVGFFDLIGTFVGP